MKKLLLIYIVLLFVVGCKNKEKKFDSIEIMVYGYKWDKLNDSNILQKPNIKCYMYALIDNNDSSTVVLQNYNTSNKIKYLATTIDKNIINRLVDSLSNLTQDTVFRTKQIFIFEGPSIKIRLNKGDKSKTFSYIDDFKNRNNFYLNFVWDVYFKQNSNNRIAFIDTNILNKRNLNFINYSFHIDTLKIASIKKYHPPIDFIPIDIEPDDDVTDN